MIYYCGMPSFATAGSRHIQFHQLVGNRRVGIALQGASVHEAHNVGFVLVDDHLPVFPSVIANEVGVGDAVLPIRHPFLQAPSNVL